MDNKIRISWDTETTGHEFGKDRIVSLGIAIYQGNEYIKKHYWEINPEIKSSQGAYEVHKLSDEYLKTKPLLKDIYQEILDVLVQSNSYEVAAYNGDFDTIMISTELKRIKDENPDLPSMHEYITQNYPDYIPYKNRSYKFENGEYNYTGIPISQTKDQIVAFIDMFPTVDLLPPLVSASLAIKNEKSGRETLDAIANRLDISLDSRKERHDALVDAEIAMQCYIKLLETKALDKPIIELEKRFAGAELKLERLTENLKIQPNIACSAISFVDRKNYFKNNNLTEKPRNSSLKL